MCGISGFFDHSETLNPLTLNTYCEVMNHRGPNDKGTHFQKNELGNLGLAHVRLSIQDLSALGQQPMYFNQYNIVLNGEIYNFKEIRQTLLEKGYTFNSETDTEVVLKAFDYWGMDCVAQFIGMFAFAITDNTTNKIYLCRDRAGVKPLYYYIDNKQFVFGSELKVFLNTPTINKTINPTSFYEFLQYGYVKGPDTLLNKVYKLEPGNWLIVDQALLSFKLQNYWKIIDYYKLPKFAGSFEEAVDASEKIIQTACNYRMIADVPVGIFLSGGFDSSMVTALLQKNNSQKLKTFTIGFPDGVDESEDATKIAQYLGTDHTSYNCTYHDAKTIIPTLPYFFDEPIGDISAIPTMLVSKLAKKEVTVALSADGGDELFGGYPGYKQNIAIMEQINKIPFAGVSSQIFQTIGHLSAPFKPWFGKKTVGIGKVLKHKKEQQFVELYKHVNGLPTGVINQVVKSKKQQTITTKIDGLTDVDDALFVIDFEQSLRDYLLIKVDRATMAYSLEGRDPLLDHKLIEFSAQLPFHYKIDANSNKKIIKEIVYKYIPKEMMDRPKIGFDLPIFDWLKTDLKFLLEEFLSKEALQLSGLLNVEKSSYFVKLFLTNQLKENDLIWRLLVFQMWYFAWIKNK